MADRATRRVLQPIRPNNSDHTRADKTKTKLGTPQTPVTELSRSKTKRRKSGPSVKSTPRTVNKYTPYHKTPKTRLLHRAPSGHHRPASSSQTEISNLKDLVKRTFRVCRVSPLNNYNISNLRQYSKKLSAHIQAEQKKGFAVEAETADTAQFSVVKGLKINEDEPEAILITLKQSGVTGGRVVVRALLCCVGASTDQLAPHRHVTLLPLLLIHGPLSTARCLTQWLQMEFDCHVGEQNFSSLELGWMVAMWGGSVPVGSGKTVHLSYTVPSEVDGLSSIDLNIDVQDCARLWQSITVSEEGVFSDQEVVSFIRSIEEHYHRHFKINFECLSLQRVATASVYVGVEGKIKLLSAANIQLVLSHITSLMLERTLRPS